MHSEAVFARVYDTQNVRLPLICFHFGEFEESVNWEVAGYRLLRTLVNTLIYQSDGPVVVSASQPVRRGFEPRQSHTKDFKNGAQCLLVWRST